MSAETKARLHVTSEEIRQAQECRRMEPVPAAPASGAALDADPAVASDADVPQTPVTPDFGTSTSPPGFKRLSELVDMEGLTDMPSDEQLRDMFQKAAEGGTSGTSVENDEENDESCEESSSSSRAPLTQHEKDQAVLLIAHGHSLRQAAARIGRSHMTLSRYMRGDEAFAAQVERYRGYAESDAMVEVVKASRKSWRAAAWLLKYLERRSGSEGSGAP